jgi:hypothetical protein
MHKLQRFSGALAVMAVLSASACSDFVTGGELTTDPNRPTSATNGQLFLGIQANAWETHTAGLARLSGYLTQQLNGTNSIPVGQYQYNVGEGFGGLRAIYGGGGLKDLRTLQASVRSTGDSVFLGITQVQEALLVSMAADAWGDITYSDALSGAPNPALDDQLAIFDKLQLLLDTAIINLGATGPTNFGPGTLDASYQGNAARWRRLANTLKARMYMHDAEVPARATAAATYTPAINAGLNGILLAADDFKSIYTGVSGSQNPWFQIVPVRGIFPDRTLDSIMTSRSDPRRAQYFVITGGVATAISAARLANNFPQPIATAIETNLILAEAYYRSGNEVNANARLNTARGLAGLGNVVAAGSTLLQEILTEEYINDFQLGVEAWKLYRRTCFPNIASKSPTGLPMPGRVPYDGAERLSNSNMPAVGTGINGLRNKNDPPNAAPEVGGGASCRAGA